MGARSGGGAWSAYFRLIFMEKLHEMEKKLAWVDLDLGLGTLDQAMRNIFIFVFETEAS